MLSNGDTSPCTKLHTMAATQKSFSKWPVYMRGFYPTLTVCYNIKKSLFDGHLDNTIIINAVLLM